MATSAPSTAAVSAAVRPAPPVPSTITSTSLSQFVTAAILSRSSSVQKFGQFFGRGDDGVATPLHEILAVRDQVDAGRRRGWQPVHRNRQAVGVRLDLAVCDHPTALPGEGDQITLTGPGRHAGQQCDAGGPALERIAAALVE